MNTTQARFIDSDKNNSLFFATLRKRVDAYFKENGISRHKNSGMVIKTIVLLSLYVLPFVYILVFQPPFYISILLWTLMGFSKAGVGMSVMHDANHGAYSSSRKVNTWIGYTLNLLGGSVFNWKLQHNILHHTYTNIVDLDDDVADKAMMRFSPHTKVRWYHSIQYIYAFAFYGVLTLYWAIGKDFIQYVKYRRAGVNKQTKKQNAVVFAKIIIGKLLYFFIFFFVPVFLVNIPFLEILSGFLLMHFIAGIMLTVIFQLAHSVEETSYPLADSEGNIESNWAVHQLKTTVNFSRKNKLLSWYVGGLNFQIEHHLFPSICHVHYPEIAKIVKATTEEYNIPYMEHTTFMRALQSHLRTLKKLGRLPHINEAIA